MENADYYRSLIRYKVIYCDDEAAGVNSLSAPGEVYKTVTEAAQHLSRCG